MSIVATVSHTSHAPNVAHPHRMFAVRENGGDLEYMFVCRHGRTFVHEMWLPTNYDALGRMAQRGFIIQWVALELFAA